MSTEGDSPGSWEIVHVVALVGAGGQFGGPTTVAVGLVRELAARGHRATFVALRQGDVAPPPGLGAEAWVTFPARRFVPRTGMLGLFNLRVASRLWRAAGTADVVHVHAGRDLVSIVALLVARLRGTPVVAQTHGMVLPRRSLPARCFDAVFLPLLRRSRPVLYLTDSEHADLLGQLGPGAQLRYLPNGLTLPDTSPAPTARPQVVFAARLHPVKRVLAFAEAARLLVADGVDADFVVLGPDQGDLARLLELTQDPALGGRLRYAGALDHDSTLQVVSSAQVFVLPSSADWMPMSLLEAMSAGVATVSTTSCGLAGTIAAADAGLVIEGAVEEIADAVRRLLEDVDLAARLGRNARELVREKFAITSVVDDLEQIYAEACIPAVTRATTRSRPSLGERNSSA